MGTSSSACYDCGDSNENRRKRNAAKMYFDAFKNIFEILHSLSTMQSFTMKIFLISSTSIPNFINLINDSKILDKLHLQSDQNIDYLENDFIKHFTNYELDKNIKIYSDYQICKSLIDSEKEFIIVGNPFIENMHISSEITNNKEVIFNFDRQKKIMEIKFPISHRVLEIKQKKVGFFQFINNKIEDKKDNFKPLSNIENSINKKRFIIRNSRMEVVNNNFYSENSKNNANNNKKIKIIHEDIIPDDNSHNSFLKENKNNEDNKKRNQKSNNKFNENIKKNIQIKINKEYIPLNEELFKNNENEKNVSSNNNNNININNIHKNDIIKKNIKNISGSYINNNKNINHKNLNLIKDNNFPSLNKQYIHHNEIISNKNNFLINNDNNANNDNFKNIIPNNNLNSLLNNIKKIINTIEKITKIQISQKKTIMI